MLSYDLVFVPHPAWTGAMLGLSGGFPRQVPSDAVAAALGHLLPGDLVEKALLLAVFAVAAAGAARAVPGDRLAPKLAAAAFYCWNPFVAERLLLGQWALLLGYAGLPWVLTARTPAGLARALLPAAVGGFAAWNVSALVVLGRFTARPRRIAASLAVLLGLALPWLVPALLAAGGGRTDPAGVDLFAPRADTPFGTVGSLLSLGGLWNAEAVPPGFGSWPIAAGRLLLSLAAIAAFAVTLRRTRDPLLAALAWSAGAGFAVACLASLGPGRALVRGLVGFWPGFGVLRDAHTFVAPLALLQALGVAFLVTLAVQRALGALGAVLVAAPVVLLPTLAGQLRAVDFPADWTRAQQMINADPAAGYALALPWGGYRNYAWNHGRTVLDPLPRMLARRTVWNDGLRVGDRALAVEDPLARDADALLRAPGPLTGPLAAAGYRYVVLAKVGDPGEAALRARLAGARTVLDGRDLTVLRLDGREPAPAPPGVPVLPVTTGDILALCLVLWSYGTYATTLVGTPRTSR
ncbi:hypothetical protein [Actinomadura parmotrematis]|uniref:YfhO family protein n=1 Tax=Actinomadura parmotrematis TaxID=2864039 RepID=A0ABS7G4B9_9ACTN|nr:hypothetical protein [Actinomadura parmotrematis]MBW8487567.1 hypothetical protein [Actinomadura parmotrematis]